jgi:hypothetical protein
MKECWAEGSLRAYHDGELLPAGMDRVTAHLAVCPDCKAMAEEIAGRARRVAVLMDALPAPEQVIWMPRREPVRARLIGWPVWAGAAAALAAGIAIVLWISPRHPEQPAPAPQIAEIPSPVRQQAVPVVLPAAVPAATARPVRRREPRPVFLTLDDEPIETGFVVRVALGEAGIPADVIYGSDGRAHAIRLVSNTFQK